MSADIEVRGTTQPDDIAAVLTLLQRACAPTAAPLSGIAAWRARRRAALARPAQPARH